MPRAREFWNVDPLQIVRIALLVAMAVTWLGGGNYVFFRRYEALGESGWTFLVPFRNHFKILTGRDWLALLGLAALAMTFGVVAVMLTPILAERAAV